MRNEEIEIEIIGGNAQVTKTTTVEDVQIYTKEDVEHEILTIDADIAALQEKKTRALQILDSFPK